MKISAILWDYDGTLVDSTRKNIEVTKDVLKNFIPDLNNNLPQALTSVENYTKANYKYKNWRELYKLAYGLSDEQIDEAGKLWSPYQLKNDTLPDMFDQMDEVIKKLSNIKQGICSQNCSKNIYKSEGYNTRVICISASYSGNDSANWNVKPDFTAYSTTEILDIIDKISNS